MTARGDTMRIRTLLAVTRLHDCQPSVSIDDVMREIGRSRATTHKHLRRLVNEGWVAWDTSKQGTLRPLVHEVAV